MKPISSAQIARLARDPVAMMRHLASGELPQARCSPSSPLIDALRQIPPRHLGSLIGFEVGPALGYSGSRVFRSAAQAMLWLVPAHAGDSHPAESWRDKRFHGKIWLDDILSHCASHPEGMAEDFPRLMDPARKPPPAVAEAPAPVEPRPAGRA